MIIFRKVRWKNFISTGDYWNEIDLSKNKSTLIVGENGAGKSTMLDALSFGLFGKPFRNTNKPELVNSINKKNTVVEVEFDIGPNSYKVIRGLKPVKFEIWRNDEMFNQSSHAKEFQKLLEQNILKLNHKSFHQIVVIGSSSFVPFMQLPTGQRREIIEDLLDINIFTKMNGILRERMSSIKDKLKENNNSITLIDSKITIQRKYISDLKRINSEALAEKKERLEALGAEYDKLQKENDEIVNALLETKFIDLNNHQNKCIESLSVIDRNITAVNTKLKQLQKTAEFFDNNENCPTCEQHIEEDKRSEKLDETKTEAMTLLDKKEKYKNTQQIGIKAKKKLDDINSEYNSLNNTISSNKNIMSRVKNDINAVQNDLLDSDDNKDSIISANDMLNGLIDEKGEMAQKRIELSDQQSYNMAISEMLKDGGIKTKIIKQYIPVMNKLINQYLNILDFFVQFELNQEFSETIKSRYRDNFTYGSFSEGEKQRIDLALLFTWRHIARMKNSVATNLLVLDETFDSSLDTDGTENLMKIMDTLEDGTNTYVISHKGAVMENKFHNKIEFYKDKNFSRMK